MQLKILIVDDERFIVTGLVSIVSRIKSVPCEVKGTDSVCTALKMLEEFRPELVITDIRMPEMSGFEFMRKAAMKKIHSKFVILTGHNDFNYARQAIRLQAIDYLLKPIDKEELYDVIQKTYFELYEQSENIEPELREVRCTINKVNSKKLPLRLKRILEYINAYYKEVSLTDIGDYFGLSPAYISQLFKRELGFNYLYYLDCVRLEKASHLLLYDRKKTVRDITRDVGYQTERQFYKMFKKRIGMTPNDFRETHGKARKIEC